MPSSQMTSRQRGLLAIEHTQPDHVPVDFRATDEAVARIQQHLGVADYRGLLDILGVDFWYVPPVERLVFQHSQYIGPGLKRHPDGSWDDFYGVTFKPVQYMTTGGPGFYQELVRSPLAEASTVAEVDAYPWPEPSWIDISGFAAECDANAGRATIGGAWATVFGDSWRLQGLERFLLNLAAAPDVAEAIIDHVEQFYTELNVRIFELAKGKLDIFYMGSDFGTQQSLLMSRRMFQRFFKPRLARLSSLAHRYGCKVMMHCCGAVRQLIPDFIETGIDILDPVQVSAAGMDLVELKREFGQDICFHGGLSTQQFLPFHTPEQIRDEVRRVLEIMMPGGGFIFQPDHRIQLDVPIENILATYRAAKDFGAY